MQHNIPGWRFEPEAIGEQARAVLATTNLFNGTFHGPEGTSVTVFAAEWYATDSVSMSVVQHTPDICWVGAGWIPSALGQPQRIGIPLDGHAIPFECRVFKAPGVQHPELVLWCTLVGGAVLPESGRWAVESNPTAGSRTRFDWAGRRVGVTHFIHNILARRPGSGEKQFVRLSVRLDTDWDQRLPVLVSFADAWLNVSTRQASHGFPDSPLAIGIHSY